MSTHWPKIPEPAPAPRMKVREFTRTARRGIPITTPNDSPNTKSKQPTHGVGDHFPAPTAAIPNITGMPTTVRMADLLHANSDIRALQTSGAKTGTPEKHMLIVSIVAVRFPTLVAARNANTEMATVTLAARAWSSIVGLPMPATKRVIISIMPIVEPQLPHQCNRAVASSCSTGCQQWPPDNTSNASGSYAERHERGDGDYR